MIRWHLERWRPRGVSALEVWDLPYRGGLLYERLSAKAVEDAMARGLTEREIDSQLAEGLAHLAELAAPKSPVWVAGGLATRPGIRAELEVFGLKRVRFAASPLFPGEAGGRAELSRRGLAGGLVVDLGQTALKLSALGPTVTRQVLPRSISELPRFLTELPPPPLHVAAEQAARLAGWLSSSIAAELTANPAIPSALVLALPCALEADGEPGPCTYAGWAHDATWVPRMLARLEALVPPSHRWRESEVPVLLVNDAELAATSAACEPGAELHARTLAVTLGFGPGAAWLEPERARG